MSELSRPLFIHDFLAQEVDPSPFLVDPYVPTRGIVFLHGKAGIGKSPLTWELARAVATGTPFLGLPTRQGTVLYIDVDTHKNLLIPRMRGLPTVPMEARERWTMWDLRRFDVLSPHHPTTQRIRDHSVQASYDLVILNTLRKMYEGDDRDSIYAHRVYGTFQDMFPESVIWINHHDKKTGDPRIPRDEDDDFAGSKAWLNDANAAIHLKVKHGAPPGTLLLDHTKSQASAKAAPLTLHLAKDGHTLTVYSFVAEAWRRYHATDPNLPREARVALVCEQLGKGRSTVRDALRQGRAVYEVPGHKEEPE